MKIELRLGHNGSVSSVNRRTFYTQFGSWDGLPAHEELAPPIVRTMRIYAAIKQMKSWSIRSEICQGGELNSRPRAYESPALPLSYPGAKFFCTLNRFFLNPAIRSPHDCLYTILGEPNPNPVNASPNRAPNLSSCRAPRP